MSEPPRSVRIVSVLPLDDLHVRLDFDDGAERTIDLTPLLEGNVYKQIRLSEKYFRTVHIESGSLVWDNGAMLDADLLRYGPPPPPPVPKAKSVGKTKKPAGKLILKPAAKAVAKPVAKPVKAKAKPVAKAAVKTPAKKVATPVKVAAKPVKAKVAPKVVAKALAKATKAKPAPKAKAKAVAKPVKKTAKPAKKKR